jgi:hypothetical protein
MSRADDERGCERVADARSGCSSPPEVEASIARFVESDGSPDMRDVLRDLIGRHRAVPAFQPLTEPEVAELCKRYPDYAIHIYASRKFAEAVRAVAAVAEDADLAMEFECWTAANAHYASAYRVDDAA